MKKVMALAVIGLLVWFWTATAGPAAWGQVSTQAKSEVLVLAESAIKWSGKLYRYITTGA